VRHLAAALARSGVRYFLSFLLIVAVLAAGRLALEELEEFRLAEKELAELSGGRLQVEGHLRRLQSELHARVAVLEKAPLDRLGERVRSIDEEIVRLSAAQAADAGWLSAMPGPGFIDRLQRDAELNLLLQEKEYLTLLRSTLETLQKGPAHLETLRRAHVAAYEKLLQNVRERGQVAQEHRIASRIYGLAPYRKLRELDESYVRLAEANAFAHRGYERQRRLIEAATTARHRFEVRREQIDQALGPLYDAIHSSEQRNLGSWVRKSRDLVKSVLPAALLVLAAILLVPPLVKALFYFVLAPLASRRPPVFVLPGASGAIDLPAGGPSAVSVAIEVGAGEELLVHPEYLQSSPAGAAKDTKWLLDWSYPFSSLAAGMAALVRIRAAQPETVVISGTRDPLSEVAILGLPAGSAVVLRPRSLVAVAGRRTEPLRITTHWRLRSLHAWLTLQLRYVVFHGPARLVVKGCRGVRVEKAGAGRRINQAATMGFSANLAYSTTRCDTFAAYLMGEQELFNDSFAGVGGFCIYEEMPHPGARAGVTGRGLEGLTDSMLKAFGL